MKPTAWLLNFARGDLVVDADLVEAVAAKRIAGAVLDVFVEEPLPPTSPLWTTEGIVVFPTSADCIRSAIRRWPRSGWRI